MNGKIWWVSWYLTISTIVIWWYLMLVELSNGKNHLPACSSPTWSRKLKRRTWDWRYLPYPKPIFPGYVKEYSHKIWPYISWYRLFCTVVSIESDPENLKISLVLGELPNCLHNSVHVVVWDVEPHRWIRCISAQSLDLLGNDLMVLFKDSTAMTSVSCTARSWQPNN